MYISLGADKERETTELHRITKKCNGRAVIIGDLNARCRPWETKKECRGKQNKAMGEGGPVLSETSGQTVVRHRKTME